MAFEAIVGILRGEKHIFINTVVITRNSFLDGAKIADVDFKQRKITLFGVVSNHSDKHHKNKYIIHDTHFYFNPALDFVWSANDILVVFGHEFSIEYLHDQLEKSRLKKGF